MRREGLGRGSGEQGVWGWVGEEGWREREMEARGECHVPAAKGGGVKSRRGGHHCLRVLER